MSGKRSLAEFFINNLAVGNGVYGFTDVYFCPLLVNDLAHIFLKMLDGGLSGLYHVLSRDCVSKYEFGVAIAQRFGFDQKLIAPTSVEIAGLKASRSPRLTLKVDKLTQALGEPLPDLSTGIDSFYTLSQQGYPQKLRQLGSL